MSGAQPLCFPLVQPLREAYIRRAMKSTTIPILTTLSALCCACLLLSSCSSTKGLPEEGPLDPATVVAAVNARSAGIRTVQGYGTVSVETPEISNSGNIQVRISRPDSMYIDITGPFGIGVAKGLVTNEAFQIYNGLENTILTGRTSSRNLKSVLRIEVDFHDVASAVAGAASIPSSGSLTGRREAGAYILTQAGDRETIEYAVDLENAAVTERRILGPDGALLEKVSFRDFRRRSDIALPTQIVIARPPKSENLTISYERLVLNDMPVDFSFRYPKSATKINF